MATLPKNPKNAPEAKRTYVDILTQIGRVAAQGATFGIADEIEAFVRSLGSDATYSEIVSDVRQNIDSYRRDYPKTALGIEIISSIPTALGGGVAIGGLMKGASALQKGMTAGGIEGAIYGAGASDTPTLGERATSAAVSAPFGVAGGALGEAIRPVASEAAKRMLGKGFPLTMGQYFGGKVGSAESKIALPFLEETIGKARAATFSEFDRQIVEDALSGLGKQVPKGMTGEQLLDFAEDAIQEAYEDVVPKAKLNTEPVDLKMKTIMDSYSGKSGAPEILSKAEQEMAMLNLRSVYSRFKSDGKMSGKMLKDAESKMSELLRSPQLNTREKDFFKDIRQVFRDEISRQNPELPDLQKANKAFAKIIPVKKVVEKRIASQGDFTPEQFLREIKKTPSSDPTKQFAREARDVLGAPYRSSGTAERQAMSEFIQDPLGSGLGIPASLAGSLLYRNPVGRAIGRGVVAPLPSRAVRGTTPFMAASIPQANIPNPFISEAQASQDRDNMMMSLLGEQPQRITVRPEGSQYLLTD
jgi:hypothetical protein